MCCERCGYDLRTLDVAGVCPECALPIQETRNAAAEPLAADRRAIRRAALVLLIAFAARMAVLALVLLLRWVIDRNVVWPSVISQVLQPWPFDITVSFAWRLFRPFAAGDFMWIVVQAAFAAQFAVQCVGVALLTARPQSRFTWPATLLRHAARWSAVLGILLGGALRITVEAGRRTIFDLLLWEPSIWCIFVIPRS